MNRFLSFWLIIYSVSISISAREYEILGRIFDAQTEKRLSGATITIVNPADGNIHGTHEDKNNRNKDDWFLMTFVTEGADSLNLLMRIQQPGYKPKAIPLNVGRNFPKRTELDEPIWMINDTSAFTAETYRTLKEVTVVSTRIKMVVRGDTLIYDAAAFQLSEGSMLDALVTQLPGVTLDNQGKIMVNGKFVNSLLIDGKDFFSGDPNIALRNLPVYIVKNVKVYNRNEDGTRKESSTTLDDDLVMDVRLKKQYQQGFLANIEGGYGTDNRYIGKLFALEYARNGRIGLFANINNINNDSRGPGLWDENWRDSRLNEGDRRILKMGIDWQWSFFNERDSTGLVTKSFGIDGTAIYTLEHKNLTELMSSTQFFTEGNRYGRSLSDTHSRDEQLQGSLYIAANLSKNIFVALSPSFAYQTGRFTTRSSSADFTANPREDYRGEAIDSIQQSIFNSYATDNLLIYRENHDATTKRQTIGTSGNLNISIGNFYLYGKLMNVYFDWDYNNLRYRSNDNRRIDYRDIQTENINKLLLTTAPGYNLKLSPSVRLRKKFDYENGATDLTVRYRMGYSKEKGEQAVYNLSEPDTPINDALIDITNSFYSLLTSTDNAIIAEIKVNHNLSPDWSMELKANQELKYLHRNQHYTRASIDTILNRNNLLYTPELILGFTHDSRFTRKYELIFRADNTPVTMTRIFNTIDNTDPINIYLGNPNLRSSTTYFGSLRYEQRQSMTQRVLTAHLKYYNYANRVGQLKIYDRTIGSNTYIPVNVDGSYRLNGTLDFTTPFPTKSKRFWFTSSTRCDYLHNPDYVSKSTAEAAVKEAIRNLSLSQDFRLQWNIAQDYTIGANIAATWSNATSSRTDFVTINAVDIRGGLTANLKLPGEIVVATDFSVTKRYGYEDDALNNTDWLCNARIERSFFKGKLTAKVDAYDILNRMNNVKVRINSLGRTEVWTNSMTRYVLLSLLYRFSVLPKR